MAKSPLKAVQRKVMTRSAVYDVYIISTGDHVAKMSFFSDTSCYRFTLDNYPHNHSKMYGTLKACLAAIEKEVL